MNKCPGMPGGRRGAPETLQWPSSQEDRPEVGSLVFLTKLGAKNNSK